MRLWLLRPVGYPGSEPWGGSIPATPWDPWYDKAFGFVVRARTEEEARAYADAKQGAEGSWSYERAHKEIPSSWDHPWLNPALTMCQPFGILGEEGVVMRDFHAS